jgi:hypothetical protein
VKRRQAKPLGKIDPLHEQWLHTLMWPVCVLKIKANFPACPLRKRERHCLAGTLVERRAVERRWLKKLFEADEEVKGTKSIRRFLRIVESRLRLAFQSEPIFRRYIRPTPSGRYFAHPGELMNLISVVNDRKAGGERRVRYATERRRRGDGRFV